MITPWTRLFRSQKPEARSQKSGVRSQESEVRSQKSGVRSQKSGVRSQKSGVRSQNNSVSGLFKKALQFTLNPFKTGLNPGRVDGLSGFSGCTLFFSFIGIITGLEEKKTAF
jgi:hypothetical protein